jgi:RimJ/RimL family protein N-acetyltransferase
MSDPIPTLHTPRLLLRAFAPRDLPAFAAMERDPAVREFRGGNLLDEHQVWTAMQMLLGQWALRGYGVFALERRADAVFVGFAGILHPADWPEPELAYSLARPHWGEGLAVEAAAAARDWAARVCRFPRLVSFILADNARSKRVAARLGAVRDGCVVLRGTTAERWRYDLSPG